MHISCIHCGHHFDHDAPAHARGSATAVCPSCGRDTPATEAWGLDGGGFGAPPVESRVYCFNCGKAMTPREGELIPVCDDCRQERAEPGLEDLGGAPAAPASEAIADWMIRKANGNVYGPFPADTIVEWINGKKINPDEEVAHIGGAWRLFGQHEEFGKFFDKVGGGDSGGSAPQAQDISFRRSTPIRDAVRSAGRAGIAVALLAVVGGIAWYAIENDLLVVPEDTVKQLGETIDAQKRKETEVPIAEGAQELLDSLAATHAPSLPTGVEAPSAQEYMLRGRTLMLRDTVADLRSSRVELEKAVALEPENPLALGALAEIYNVLVSRGLGSLDLQRQSIYLLDLAERVNNFPAETMRARSTFLIFSGNEREGVMLANAALQKNPADPELYYLLGVAEVGTAGKITEKAQAQFDRALELDARFHQVYYELGRGAEDDGDLTGAIAHYNKKIELDPRSADSHDRLGAIYEGIGDRAAAVEHYDAAVRLHPTNLHAVWHRAVLAYQVDGQAARAASMLRRLLDSDANLRIRERLDLGTHLGAALRLSGDKEGALKALEVVLKEDKTHSGALFQKAVTLVSMGRGSDAIPSFTRSESTGLSPSERARIYFWQGHASLQGGQPQDALESFNRARETDLDFMPAYLWAAYVTADIGNPKNGAMLLQEAVGRDALDYGRPRDPDLFFEPLPDLKPVADTMVGAAKAEGYTAALNVAAGVVLFHQGDGATAAKYLEKGIQQEQRNETALFYQGLIDWQNKDWSRAHARFLGLVNVQHARGVYHAYLAGAAVETDRLDDAVAAYEKAFGYGGDSPWARTLYARALAGKGDTDGANAQLGKAIAADARYVLPRKQRFDLGL